MSINPTDCARRLRESGFDELTISEVISVVFGLSDEAELEECYRQFTQRRSEESDDGDSLREPYESDMGTAPTYR